MHQGGSGLHHAPLVREGGPVREDPRLQPRLGLRHWPQEAQAKPHPVAGPPPPGGVAADEGGHPGQHREDTPAGAPPQPPDATPDFSGEVVPSFNCSA